METDNEAMMDELGAMEESINSGESVDPKDTDDESSSSDSDKEEGKKDSKEEENKDEDEKAGKDAESEDEDEDEHDDEEGGDEDKDKDKDNKDDEKDTTKDSVIEGLKNDISDLKTLVESLTKKDPDESPKTSKEEEFKPESFINDEDDLEDIVHDSSKFNEVLNKILLRGIEIGKSQVESIKESLLKSIPGIINQHIDTTNSLKELSTKFYNDNEDLKPFKKVVMEVFKEKSTEEPDKSYKEVLSMVPNDVRKRLGLPDKSKTKSKKSDNEDEKGGTPKLPKKGSQKRPSNKRESSSDSVLSELDEMEQSLNS